MTTSLPTAEQVCEQLNCLFTGNPANSDQISGQKACVCVICQADALITAQAAEIERLTIERDTSATDLVDDRDDANVRAEAAEASLAAVMAERDAMQWQPIETAAKDGGYIIAGRFEQPDELMWVKHSRWMTAHEAAENEGGDPHDYDAGWTDGDDEEEPCYPTHWMPLPALSLDAQGEK